MAGKTICNHTVLWEANIRTHRTLFSSSKRNILSCSSKFSPLYQFLLHPCFSISHILYQPPHILFNHLNISFFSSFFPCLFLSFLSFLPPSFISFPLLSLHAPPSWRRSDHLSLPHSSLSLNLIMSQHMLNLFLSIKPITKSFVPWRLGSLEVKPMRLRQEKHIDC